LVVGHPTRLTRNLPLASNWSYHTAVAADVYRFRHTIDLGYRNWPIAIKIITFVDVSFHSFDNKVGVLPFCTLFCDEIGNYVPKRHKLQPFLLLLLLFAPARQHG
jgi:hypothetical protein